MVVEIWNHIQQKQAEQINLSSIAPAKTTLLIKAIADSFGKKGNNNTELDDFLPFKLDSFAEEEVGSETIMIYKYYNKIGLIPKHVKRALGKNSNILKLLRKKD